MANSAVSERICQDGFLAFLLDSAPELFLFVDEAGAVRAASAKIKDFFDLDPAELVDQPINVSAEKMGRCFTEFMTYHEVIGYPLHDQEHEFLRDIELSLPKHRYLQVVSAPVQKDGRYAGRLWLMRDVTSDREITELKIQYGGARGADELKSKFLTVVSHQMRTPLNAVRWNVESLLSGNYPGIVGEPRDMLQEVYQAVVSSISIVDDMLLAVDIEQRAMRLEKTEANVADIVTKVAHDFSRSASLKFVALKVADMPTDLPRLFIDGGKIETVVSRLVDNAIRYTPAGGTVTLKVSADKKDVLISVSDTGIGIAERERPRVFERFFRSKSAVGIHPNASGLGLYISKYIVDAHDGAIDYVSREGGGTTFIVRLPRRIQRNSPP